MNLPLIKSLQKNHPGVTLIMASKYLDAQALTPYIEAGITHYGENRVDQYVTKKKVHNEGITWHFIGTLQSKKVKKVINDIDCLHTIDRFKLIEEIKKHRITPLDAFIQFNISGEPSKHGFLESDIPDIIKALQDAKVIQPIGVMGMAEHSDEPAIITHQFETLKTIQRTLNLAFPSIQSLSMGMSDDYEIALALGTTHLRLGRILLEEPHGI